MYGDRPDGDRYLQDENSIKRSRETWDSNSQFNYTNNTIMSNLYPNLNSDRNYDNYYDSSSQSVESSPLNSSDYYSGRSMRNDQRGFVRQTIPMPPRLDYTTYLTDIYIFNPHLK